MKTYQITLTERQKEAVLAALCTKAWMCHDATALKTYDETYEEICKQLNEQ